MERQKAKLHDDMIIEQLEEENKRLVEVHNEHVRLLKENMELVKDLRQCIGKCGLSVDMALHSMKNGNLSYSKGLLRGVMHLLENDYGFKIRVEVNETKTIDKT